LSSACLKAEAERTLERNQQLANAGAISRQSWTRAVVTAREAVRVLADVSAQADVRSNIAGVQQLKPNWNKHWFAAGELWLKNVEIGNVTAGTQQLFSIIRGGLLEVEAQIPAIQLPQVRVGAPAQITSILIPRSLARVKLRL